MNPEHSVRRDAWGLWDKELFGTLEGKTDWETVAVEAVLPPDNTSVEVPDTTLFSEEMEKEEERTGRLLSIMKALGENKRLLHYVTEAVAARSKDASAASLEPALANISSNKEAFRYARLIEGALGAGAMRKIAPIAGNAEAASDIEKTLKRDFKAATFEGKVEDGYFTNIKADYGIEWSVEKAGRDAFQNFYDANKKSLAEVTSTVETIGTGEAAVCRVLLSAKQTYDWRMLVSVGASSKQESDSDVGGFGEGAKMLALVLLRDHGAQSVKYASGDWQVEFYIDTLPEGSSSKADAQGLWMRKRTVTKPIAGNALEIVFPSAKEKTARELLKTRELFLSKENPDMKDATFNNQVGGFKIIFPSPEFYKRHGKLFAPAGHLYAVGQRTHVRLRDRWDNVDYLHVWTWKKTLPKDRDRGVVSTGDLKEKIIAPIAESMTLDEAEKVVFDFEPLWDKFAVLSVGGRDMLYLLCKRLQEAGKKLSFERKYIADDIRFNDPIGKEKKETLQKAGYVVFCDGFLSMVGMPTAEERYAELTAGEESAAA